MSTLKGILQFTLFLWPGIALVHDHSDGSRFFETVALQKLTRCVWFSELLWHSRCADFYM
jgi:hypothetical protein